MDILNRHVKDSSAQYLKSRLLQNFKAVGLWHWIYITYETLSLPSLKILQWLLKDKPSSLIWCTRASIVNLAPFYSLSSHYSLPYFGHIDLLSHFSFCISKSASYILSYTLLLQTSSLLFFGSQPEDSFKLAPSFGDKA